jgi:hypothetical protein
MQAVFIVRADRPDLYEYLRARLGDGHRVILDRRDQTGGAGGRPGERRQPPTTAERKLWSDSGYFVIFEPGPAEPARRTAPAVESGPARPSALVASP